MEILKPNGRPPELGFVPMPEGTGELAPSAAAAAEVARIHGAILSAKRFPRDEDRFLARLLATCRKPAFADQALYSFPRGGEDITGPSVVFAREALRLWGNATTSLEVLRDDANGRKIRGRAFDFETTLEVAYEDEFAKLVQRKRSGITQWVPADERDLRELTFRRGAILIRNAILGIIPEHFTDAAIAVVEETLRAPKDPGRDILRAVDAFQKVGVGKTELERFLGHAMESTSPEEIARLKKIYRSIADGNSTWQEYASSKPAATGAEASSPGAASSDGLPLRSPFQPKAASRTTAAPVEGEVPASADEPPIPD